MRFDDLLASLGERLGAEIEDAGGAAAMEVDGVPVVLRDAGDILLLHAEVGESRRTGANPSLPPRWRRTGSTRVQAAERSPSILPTAA